MMMFKEHYWFYWKQRQKSNFKVVNKLLRHTPIQSCDWCAKIFIKKKDFKGIELWSRCYNCECELAEMRREEAESDYQDDMKAQYCEDHPDECDEEHED